MRTQKRNRQTMYYAIPDGEVPVYKRDSDGNVIYDIVDGEPIPRETGEYKNIYTEPKELYGSISAQIENALVRAWGSSDANNYAVLVVGKNTYPDIVNGTRVWKKSEIGRDDDGYVDGSTADYVVSGVLDEELNEDSYYLTKLK